MSEVIARLREDHGNFAQLLDLIENEIELFRRSERPDYFLLIAVIEYFEDYPDRFHHPAEDIVFFKLKVREPDIAKNIGDLEGEHLKEAERLQRFSELVHRVVADGEIRREIVINAARAYVAHLRRHMEMEEAIFFPAAEQYLTAEDWDEISREIMDRKDPLFDTETSDRFDSFRDHILSLYGDD